MELTVGMGEAVVTQSPDLLRAVGIGSCIAVALYDRNTSIGGLAHVMLPCIEEANDKSDPARFTDVAIGMMIEEMKDRGAYIHDVSAKIFGGANMFPEIIPTNSTMNIGERNISAAREELQKYDIEITVEDVGDHVGRTVLFDTGDGSVIVKTVCNGKKKY